MQPEKNIFSEMMRQEGGRKEGWEWGGIKSDNYESLGYKRRRLQSLDNPEGFTADLCPDRQKS